MLNLVIAELYLITFLIVTEPAGAEVVFGKVTLPVSFAFCKISKLHSSKGTGEPDIEDQVPAYVHVLSA